MVNSNMLPQGARPGGQATQHHAGHAEHEADHGQRDADPAELLDPQSARAIVGFDAV